MPLSFPVLKVVSEARNAHGLRLQDPARYNSYCTKRISTLKRSLKFIQKSKKSPPKPVTLELVQQDSRYPPNSLHVYRINTDRKDILRLCYFLQREHGVNQRVSNRMKSSTANGNIISPDVSKKQFRTPKNYPLYWIQNSFPQIHRHASKSEHTNQL